MLSCGDYTRTSLVFEPDHKQPMSGTNAILLLRTELQREQHC